MDTGNITIDNFITMLSVSLGKTYTDEQRKFMKMFNEPLISFSSPGTGKTTAAIGGLITAELFYKIPGDSIYALSFTNMATQELSNRYYESCRKLHTIPTVNFQTLHKLCSGILKEHKNLLGMTDVQISESSDMESQARALIACAEDLDINVTKSNARAVIRAVQSLNSSLVFDREHVETKFAFKKCRLSYEEFTKVRMAMYKQNKFTQVVELHDILLYTLELLLEHPEVSALFKSKCRLMLVDEFQDLSLLQLRLISLMCDNVIAIGDIKQQIYAFNGACQEVVKQYYRYFPTAKRQDLNHSFRCGDEIVDYAKKIIRPNNQGGEEFVGAGHLGEVNILNDLSLSDICQKIGNDYRKDNNTFSKSTLFLFRNNFSAIPVAEELFKQKVPMRINKYIPANKVPIVKELCEVCELALHPEVPARVEALKYLMPEMQRYRQVTDNPLYRVMRKEGISLFDVNFNYQQQSSYQALNMLKELREKILDNQDLAQCFNFLWPAFTSAYLSDKEAYLEYPSSYYIQTVAPLIRGKSYSKFLVDETKKSELIKDSEAFKRGVRCYTFHASKGLEADDVYILDADEGFIPNLKHLNEMDGSGCGLEKARDIRNERCLVYVACTRAKSVLNIAYTNELSHMISGDNDFYSYDTLYETGSKDYEDVEAFQTFYRSLQRKKKVE